MQKAFSIPSKNNHRKKKEKKERPLQTFLLYTQTSKKGSHNDLLNQVDKKKKNRYTMKICVSYILRQL